ncbi:MAG TPA: envelope stress response membrane protein PspB [Pseudomonadales bacterium]|jgi:phage shock protein B|nr:envelope stress response membrane protein PspB [Gammaproteobacteria bacterium]MDP6027448.1 envelope stress response membrane protein PspB [Pseudomonadales bacterium]MDP6315359.1 envelope stress response membrane protein PspB [Pseudomonadales bacterium]MDP7315414.1 envelope stress response membrane protein PspB [Pseudomonadales bacterium]MDP7576630.1 envelope stress response membrane protein PspB [Pseudomonadales bacterium]|tara:strand:- start:379 stop:621 length:243 start_codon:yes stop_codon:yes gene_type:complete
MTLSEFIFVPVLLFLIIVAPIWIIMHYKSVGKTADGLTSGERAELEEMIEVADKMASRIETLEAILDVESPEWREQKRQA